MQNSTPKSFFSIKKIPLFNSSILLTLFAFLCINSAIAQTPGLIFEPANGPSRLILDPNNDGFTSKTTAGFIGDDQLDSELPYASLTFPTIEPTSDLSAGPSCGFTDFADQGDQDPVQAYLSNGNWRFRMRMGSNAPNAKSYSILIDTDGKFGNTGPNRDLQYSSLNPGFEIEIVLATKFGVFVYDVNNMNCTPIISYNNPLDIHYQKSIALTTACNNPDYFYDFYVNFNDLVTPFSINAATPMRMAMISNMGASKSTLCSPSSASDIAGIKDNDFGSLEAVFTAVINNATPCAVGVTCQDRSLCPGINNIGAGAQVSGTSSEANNTVITVFKNDVSIGTTTVIAGVWTLNAITPALVAGNIITATATAPGKGTSIDNCNPQTVAFTCATRTLSTAAAMGAVSIIGGRKGASGTAVARPTGTIIKFYVSTGILYSNANLSPNPYTTITASEAWSIGVSGAGNVVPDGSYYVTFQAP